VLVQAKKSDPLGLKEQWPEMHRVNEKHNKEKVACEKQRKINEEKALNMVNFRISHR